MTPQRDDGPATLLDGGASESLAEALPDDQADASFTPDDADMAASGEKRSLINDIEDLVFDAKTYFDAELSYQKTRASFVGTSLKNGLLFAIMAAFVAVIAVIGLTVGAIIALTPVITAWGATAAVVGTLLLAVVLMLLRVRRSFRDVMDAIKEDGAKGANSSDNTAGDE